MFRQISLHKMFVGLCALILSICFTDIGFAKEKQNDQSDSYLMESAYQVDEVDRPPKCIRRDKNCSYPKKAMQCHIEGCVTLTCVISKYGRVKAVKGIEGDPEGYFEEAAIDSVKKYKFRPAIKGGSPVDCIVRIPIRYSLAEY